MSIPTERSPQRNKHPDGRTTPTEWWPPAERRPRWDDDLASQWLKGTTNLKEQKPRWNDDPNRTMTLMERWPRRNDSPNGKTTLTDLCNLQDLKKYLYKKSGIAWGTCFKWHLAQPKFSPCIPPHILVVSIPSLVSILHSISICVVESRYHSRVAH